MKNFEQMDVRDRKKIGYIALAAIILAGFLGFATWQAVTTFAQESSDTEETSEEEFTDATREEIIRLNDAVSRKKKNIESLKQRIKELQSNIKERQSRTVNLENQVGILDNRLAKTQLDIEQTGEEIDQVNLEIAALELKIDERVEQIDRKKLFLGDLIRTVARYDDRSMLEVMLLHNSFSEFFDQIKFIEDIGNDLQQTLTDVIAIKTQLEKEQDEKEVQRKKLDELKEKLATVQTDLKEEKSAKSTLAGQLALESSQLKQHISQLRSEQNVADNDIRTLEATLRKKLEESDRIRGEEGDVALSWPVPSQYITAYFHDPSYPFRHVFEHPAIDIRAGQGTSVRAAAPGFVARARNAGFGYSYVMIIHDGGISTVYGHVSKILVSEDQFVERGDVIALSGGTPGTPGAGGLTTGPHLHFETRLNGIPVNPLNYLLR